MKTYLYTNANSFNDPWKSNSMKLLARLRVGIFEHSFANILHILNNLYNIIPNNNLEFLIFQRNLTIEVKIDQHDFFLITIIGHTYSISIEKITSTFLDYSSSKMDDASCWVLSFHFDEGLLLITLLSYRN